MLRVPKTTYAQQCCALKRKMKVKEVANKIMMRDLMGVKRQRFSGVTMITFYYQNLKLSGDEDDKGKFKSRRKIHGDIANIKNE
jgi:hypothetical protein